MSVMKTTKVFKTVEHYLNKLQRTTYDVNRGGCGVFAELMYDSLLKSGLDPKIVIITRPEEMGVEEVEYNLQCNPSAKVIPFSHIVIKVGKKMIDSDGVFKDSKVIGFNNHLYIEGMTLDVLQNWNKDPYNWNDCFNRKQIPYLKRVFKMMKKDLILAKA